MRPPGTSIAFVAGGADAARPAASTNERTGGRT
jgi:hypothetical protein